MSLKRNPGFASYEQLLRLRSQNQSPLNSHKLKIEFPCGSKLGNKSLHHSRFGWPCTLNTLQKLSGAHLAIMFLLNVPHAGDTDRKSVANQSPTDSLNIINWPDSEQFEDQGLSCWNVDVQSYCTARAQHGWPCQQLRLSWKVDSACKLLWTRRVQTAKPARSPASQLPPGLFCSAAWCGRGLIPKTLLSDLSSLAHSTHGLSPPKQEQCFIVSVLGQVTTSPYHQVTYTQLMSLSGSMSNRHLSCTGGRLLVQSNMSARPSDWGHHCELNLGRVHPAPPLSVTNAHRAAACYTASVSAMA